MAIGQRPAEQRITTGIFCLESWSGNLAHRSSVRPLLELLEAQAGVKFIHRIVDTRDSFLDLLARWPSYRGYRLGYIACHGEPRRLRIGADVVALDDITTELSDRGVTLKGKTLYFGSCAVLAMPAAERTAFRQGIAAQAICGYTGEDGIDWLESAAFELLLFDYLVGSGHKTSPPALRDFKARHGNEWKRLRFVADPVATR